MAVTDGQAPVWDAQLARARIDALATLPGALLPILHALHDEFGYIDDAAIPLITDALNLSRADVIGVIHFYHDFRMEPPGRHILRVCRAEACQSMGSERLVEHLEQTAGTSIGETTADRRLTLENVYCLGNCALSPAIMLDGRLYGRITPERIDALLTGVEDRVVGGVR
ncbi:MAG: formate dehydrogenase subunit gamma [Dehalococcoidia bacterium]|nr:formate dehydrogenase subunit gamma [Dehalococcoidia bacterium]